MLYLGAFNLHARRLEATLIALKINPGKAVEIMESNMLRNIEHSGLTKWCLSNRLTLNYFLSSAFKMELYGKLSHIHPMLIKKKKIKKLIN